MGPGDLILAAIAYVCAIVALAQVLYVLIQPVRLRIMP